MNEPGLNTDEKQLRWQADNDYAWDGMADRRAYLQAALRLLDEARSGSPSPRGELDPVSDYNPTDDELRVMARDHDLYDATHRDLARLVLREREAAATVAAVLRSQTDNVIATEKLADGLAAQRDSARDIAAALEAELAQVQGEHAAAYVAGLRLRAEQAEAALFAVLKILDLSGNDGSTANRIRAAIAQPPAADDGWSGIAKHTAPLLDKLVRVGRARDAFKANAERMYAAGQPDAGSVYAFCASNLDAAIAGDEPPAAHTFIHTHKRDYCGHQPDPRGPWCGRGESEHAAGSTATPPGPLGPHSFLMFPGGDYTGCFRAINSDGRSPRCGKPFLDLIHQVAAGSPEQGSGT